MLWNYTYDTVSPIDLNKVENVDTGLPLFPYFFFTVVEKYRILIFQINTGFLCLTNSFKLYAMLMILLILHKTHLLKIIYTNLFRNSHPANGNVTAATTSIGKKLKAISIVVHPSK